MNRTVRILSCTLLIIHTTISADHTQDHEDTREHVITVFVHGIMSIKPHLNISNFLRFMTDNIEDTIYSETVRYMRENSFYFKNQAMEAIGWHKIEPERIEKGYASGLVARQFNEVEAAAEPDADRVNHYFAYGWYGLLSARIRYQNAIPLHNYIAQEVYKLRAQGIEPKVRVIGYSHGGNVCLNLGAVRQQENVDQTISVDELILLGVPIQSETDFLIMDPIFKHVYQIYSRGDRIQTLDFFSTKRFFSRKRFKSRKYFQLPEKLTQIQVRMTRKVHGHKRKKDGSCCTFNPNCIATLSGKAQHLRDASPGHIELWFYGWTPANYRQSFILNPLPFVVLLPYVLHHIKQLPCTDAQRTLQNKSAFIVDIRPDYGRTIIKHTNSWCDSCVIEYLPKKLTDHLACMTEAYRPDNYSIDEYDGYITQAKKRATREYYERYCKHKKQSWRTRRRMRKLEKKERTRKQKCHPHGMKCLTVS